MDISEYLPFWNQLTPSQRDRLSAAVSHRKVSKGTPIYNHSMDCAGLLVIHSGQLRAFILSEEGREITIYRLFERDICLFSASCMMRSLQFEVSIEAEKDSEFWMINPVVFKSIMEESAAVANYTNEIMASRFSDVLWLMEQVMWKSFDKRLAGFLLEEASINGSDTLKITHETIGHHLGTAREVVTRMLRYFQEEAMVTLTRGAIQLRDKDALEALADS